MSTNSEAVARYRQRHRDRVNEARRERYATNHDQALAKIREWNEANRERRAAYAAAFRERHREERAIAHRAYHADAVNRAKDNARSRVATALASGRIVRPPTCAECGQTRPVQGHHSDYSRPLDVLWLCGTCHKFRHLEETAA